ncbi:MAG: hypothetical protein UU48_C0004G0013 [Candidatus Uhrbacteria bacterium GW2011_GWF2_41_16]|jgi:prepilin-type N-terminal cleavage/methylation domain-containing protein|uniref:Type II secretion system protein n=2 Tax=Candidatus Uhriibacteriota TaxID=1752732 RepID=A0A0G0XN42_9BACT|nr:MAG: hypothetical protein UU31_C0008G0002 [Candidatus Uhrbacteria bacterium GW2011_GWA2_41_10]KKR86636.1 MAG: hypothetical protein UU35_C0010G0014 [Candidatus Uhrbacteria bacterium GW2011_GWC2_41_11]KKR98220.1 MAG: hypothetical protein UU48_C0004G0013 [Candidatus Uhrbacteria bacterium GW2011_GWF2_41_16]HBP00580.1 hypothetical protein [Candidatus Uhrbacteria bacterium]
MSRKGFTLIEFLVVFFVIGLVGTLAVVAVDAARSKQRDAARLSNVRQIQSAVEDFFVENNRYPTGQSIPLGNAQAVCLATDDFQGVCDVAATNVILRVVPAQLSSGLKGYSSCGGVTNAFCYTNVQEGATYTIQFELENTVPLTKLSRGLNCATPDGMKAGACPPVSTP